MNKFSKFYLLVLVALTLNPQLVVSQTTWDDGGPDDNWFNPMNWDSDMVPNGITADVIIGAPAPTIINGNVNINSLMVEMNGEVTLNPSLNLDFGGTATTTLTNLGTIVTSNNSDMQLAGVVDNVGSITVISTGSSTDLEVDSAITTLMGGGTITLSSSSAARINGIGNPLLILAAQTIEGQGNVGVNSISIDNQANGLIDANSMGNTLIVDPNVDGLTNAGIIRASNGGTLTITGSGGGLFDNTNGSIAAMAGSTVTIVSEATISQGSIETSGDGLVLVPPSQNVFFEDLSVNANVFVENNTDFGISGSINNTGSIEIFSEGSFTDVEVQAVGSTLTGGGMLTLSNSVNARINGIGNPLLTIENQSIQGRGNIGANSISIDLQSGNMIDANSTGNTLTIDPNSDGMINAGLIRASNGGNLTITGSGGGVFENSGGAISALSGSIVTMTGGANIIGGSIESSDDGMILVPVSQDVLFEDLSFNADVLTENNTDFGISGNINNAGNIDVFSTGSFTDIEIQSEGATLSGGGTINLSNSNAARIVGVSNPILIIEDQDIRGLGNIGANSLSIDIQTGNLIDANSPGNTLNIDPDATGLTNAGTMRASNGGILRFDGNGGGVFNNTNGTIEALAGSSVSLALGATIDGGAINTFGDGLVNVSASQDVLLSNLTMDADVAIQNNVDFGLSGNINNLGNIQVNSTGSFTDIEIQAEGATISGSGSVVLAGTTNARIDGPGPLNMNGGTLSGIGQVVTDATFNAVTFSPGLSIGTLTFNTDPQLVNQSTFDIELSAANANPGTTLDQIVVNGILDFGGSSGTIALTTLDNMDEPGMLADFDQSQEYVFRIAIADEIVGLNVNDLSVDTANFANSFNGVFSITTGPVGNDVALYVKYGQFAIGDVNQDGNVNLLDVAPFVDLISNAGFSSEADINCDGTVNLLDVGPFVAFLSG